MAKARGDGGPAFPVTPTDKSGQIAPTACGMSLRDWFAGQALSGVESCTTVESDPDACAEYCYKLADAMLKAREL